jgi:Ca2+-binding RTX toxin-like protein
VPRSCKAVLALTTLVLITLLPTPGARAAADTCVYDGATKTVAITFPDGASYTRTVSRGTGGTIAYDGVACGNATVTNTDTVIVSAGAGEQTLRIDQRGGRFQPGASPEGDVAEIEFSIDLGLGSNRLEVVGTPRADRLSFLSTSGIRTNGDADTDVSLSGVAWFGAYGQAGGDTISTRGVPLFARGQGGDDTLRGGNRVEGFDGGSGDDRLTGGRDRDVIEGGSGADVIRGGEGSDWLIGEGDDDTIVAGSGDDVMVSSSSGDGADTFDGGLGADTVAYSARTADLRVAIGGGARSGETGEGDLIDRNVESLVGGAGNDHLVGTSQVNALSGSAGDDVLIGRDGSDQLAGNRGGDELWGDRGDDVLVGGTGDDLVTGGDGDDTLEASRVDGDDRYRGGNGTDLVSYASRTAAVTAAIGTSGNGAAGEDDLIAVDVEALVGGTVGDQLAGSEAADILTGGDGNDSISGGAGADRIDGAAGNDSLTGDDGFDQLAGGDGDDVLHLVDQSGDTVDCGAGTDDASDRDADDTALTDCEIT